MPSLRVFCTVRKYAKTPNSVAADAIITISQKFSCASGQSYFRPRTMTRDLAIGSFIYCEEIVPERSCMSDQGGFGSWGLLGGVNWRKGEKMPLERFA